MFYFITLTAQSLNINGENNAKFVHRTAKDSLNNYFENELKFRIDRGIFSFGMSFLADLPKYEDTAPQKELRSDKLSTGWKDLFVQLYYDDFRMRVGTLEESFGVGLILRSWNNPEINKDKRLEGAQVHYQYQDLRVKGIYGKLKEDIKEDAISSNDLVSSFDAEYKIFSFLKIGATAMEYKQDRSIVIDKEYTFMNIYGGRFGIASDLFDLDVEFAEMKTFHGIPKSEFGHALYTFGNAYLGPVALGIGYKYYDNFNNNPMSDLPTLNHFDELLYSFEPEVKIEEGIQGEIRYKYDLKHEIAINYAESWDKGFNVRHSNLFTEHIWHNNAINISSSYEHLEKKSEFTGSWEKENIPTVSIELLSTNIPWTIKTKWTFNETKINEIEKSYNKPYLQIDSHLFGMLKYSIFGQYQFVGRDDISKNKLYLGAELVTNIARHTEAKLFVGKEQGGKVCRNGVCKDQAPFEGVILSLNTRF